MSSRGPDFLGIGMPSSGTRWLYDQLNSHEYVDLPAFKELHFLDRGMRSRSADSKLKGLVRRRKMKRRKYKRALKSTRTVKLMDSLGMKSLRSRYIDRALDRHQAQLDSHPDWRFLQTYLSSKASDELREIEAEVAKIKQLQTDRFSLTETVRLQPRHFEWYLSLFDPYKPKVTGDITPGYYTLDREKIRQFHGYCPHAKLVLMVRHPAERFISAIHKRVSLGLHSKEEIARRYGLNSKLSNRLTEVPDRFAVRFFTTWSAARAFENWSSVFGEDNIQVVIFDDLVSNPESVRERVCQHIGLSPDPSCFSLDAGHNRKKNRTGREKSALDINQDAIYTLVAKETKRCQELFGGSTANWRID